MQCALHVATLATTGEYMNHQGIKLNRGAMVLPVQTQVKCLAPAILTVYSHEQFTACVVHATVDGLSFRVRKAMVLSPFVMPQAN